MYNVYTAGEGKREERKKKKTFIRGLVRAKNACFSTTTMTALPAAHSGILSLTLRVPLSPVPQYIRTSTPFLRASGFSARTCRV